MENAWTRDRDAVTIEPQESGITIGIEPTIEP